MDAESHAKSEENWVQVVGKAKAGGQPKAVKKGGLFDKRSNKSGAKDKEKDNEEDDYTSEDERQAGVSGARTAPTQD